MRERVGEGGEHVERHLLLHLLDLVLLLRMLPGERADAVLAASIFHFGEYTVRQAKEFMRDRGIEVRL